MVVDAVIVQAVSDRLRLIARDYHPTPHSASITPLLSHIGGKALMHLQQSFRNESNRAVTKLALE